MRIGPRIPFTPFRIGPRVRIRRRRRTSNAGCGPMLLVLLALAVLGRVIQAISDATAGSGGPDMGSGGLGDGAEWLKLLLGTVILAVLVAAAVGVYQLVKRFGRRDHRVGAPRRSRHLPSQDEVERS